MNITALVMVRWCNLNASDAAISCTLSMLMTPIVYNFYRLTAVLCRIAMYTSPIMTTNATNTRASTTDLYQAVTPNHSVMRYVISEKLVLHSLLQMKICDVVPQSFVKPQRAIQQAPNVEKHLNAGKDYSNNGTSAASSRCVYSAKPHNDAVSSDFIWDDYRSLSIDFIEATYIG